MADVTVVDTPDLVRSMLDVLYSLDPVKDVICLDLEGVNLSRHGYLSILQMFLPSLQQSYVVDVHVLGTEVFDISIGEDRTLRRILQSPQPEKYLWDCRNDADALLSSPHRLELTGVVDVQLLELGSRWGSRRWLWGLAKCIDREGVVPESEREQFSRTKDDIKKLLFRDHGGEPEGINARPLSQALIDYCVGDVRFLFPLAERYRRRTGVYWLDQVRVETDKRLIQAKSESYISKGAQCPPVWYTDWHDEYFEHYYWDPLYDPNVPDPDFWDDVPNVSLLRRRNHGRRQQRRRQRQRRQQKRLRYRQRQIKRR